MTKIKKNDNHEQVVPTIRKPEILSPAGGLDSVKAALAAGADAVYIGGRQFGARAYAENPETEELLSAISYVHLLQKRLYLTVNTLIKEQEYSSLYEFLAPFYENGLDAAIVQDPGVVRFLHREFPELALHASTQMTLTGERGISLFPEAVTRLVPARELSLSEISNIVAKSQKEVEIFVHGALCFSYSGQCLMSSMIGGRSGNRGRCAQPCRMEYTLRNGKEGSLESAKAVDGDKFTQKSYLLSPKDLCGLSALPELIETGAFSFKIEGRMKKPEYTAAVTAAYRKFVDLYFSLGREKYEIRMKNQPELLNIAEKELAEVYNRGGFSKGCLFSRNGQELMSMERPGHYGVKIGVVTSGKKGEAEIRLSENLYAQDVLELRRKPMKGLETGTEGYYEYTNKSDIGAGTVVKARLLPNVSAGKGDPVYRMRNQQLLTELSEKYVNKLCQAEATGVFTAKTGEPMSFTVGTVFCGKLPAKAYEVPQNENVSVTVFGPVCEKAGKLPATKELVEKQLRKTGGGPFLFSDLQINISSDVFLPNGQLNEIRREAISQLSSQLTFLFTREKKKQGSSFEQPAKKDKDIIPNKPFLSCLVSTYSQAIAASENSCLNRFYLDTTIAEEERRKLTEELKKDGKQVYLCLPRILRQSKKDQLIQFLRSTNEEVDGYLIRNYEELAIVLSENKALLQKCCLDYSLPVFSPEGKDFFENLVLGIKPLLTASLELSSRELQKLSVRDMELVVYGHIPLMQTVHCVKKNTSGCQSTAEGVTELVDRKNHSIPVRRICSECLNILYNPDVLNLLSEQEELRKLSPAGLRYEFTIETPEEVKQVFKRGCTKSEKGASTSETKGHFYRGVE